MPSSSRSSPANDVGHRPIDVAAARDPGAEEAQRQAGDRQQNGVRQAQPLGERHQQADDGQHHGDGQQRVDDVGHRRKLTLIVIVVISYRLQTERIAISVNNFYEYSMPIVEFPELKEQRPRRPSDGARCREEDDRRRDVRRAPHAGHAAHDDRGAASSPSISQSSPSWPQAPSQGAGGRPAAQHGRQRRAALPVGAPVRGQHRPTWPAGTRRRCRPCCRTSGSAPPR